jgi:hypothetical protein
VKESHIYFPVVNSYKKWFRCWHGNFWPWLTSKPIFYIVLRKDLSVSGNPTGWKICEKELLLNVGYSPSSPR